MQPAIHNTDNVKHFFGEGARLEHAGIAVNSIRNETVPDLEEAVKAARGNGFHSISRTALGNAYDNARASWVFSRIYGLFEMIERA